MPRAAHFMRVSGSVVHRASDYKSVAFLEFGGRFVYHVVEDTFPIQTINPNPGGIIMKVLLINGSPRPKGNTSIALQEMEKTCAWSAVPLRPVPPPPALCRGRCSSTGWRPPCSPI